MFDVWSGAGSNRRPSAFQVNRAKRCADLRKRTSPTSETALGGRCNAHVGRTHYTPSTGQDSDPTQATGKGCAPTTPLLRRRYTSTAPRSGNLLSNSLSYIPKALVEGNPAILNENNEPWPGATLHQLSTVGIEIMKVVDEVTARMPSSAESQEWDLPPGIPLLFCWRLSYDQDGTLIEISDAWVSR